MLICWWLVPHSWCSGLLVVILGIATTLEGTCWGTAELGVAQGVPHGGRRQPMSPMWEHPGPLCPGRGSWAAAPAVGSGDNKGTWPSPSTKLEAGTAALGQEMLFAAAFDPGEGIWAMQLELLMGVKALHPGSREGGGTL